MYSFLSFFRTSLQFSVLTLVALCISFSDLQAQEIDSRIVMQIEASPCFGPCEHYKLTVYKNREAVFHGKKYVEPLGLQRRTLSRKEYRTLKRAFCRNRFKKMDSDLTQNVEDAQTITIHKHNKKSVKTVKANIDPPQKFQNIQDAFDNIRKSGEWMMAEFQVGPTAIPADADPIRFLVQLDQNVRMASWTKKYVRQGVIIDPSMVPNFNLIKIQFNPKLIKYEDLLQKLREDEEVTSVRTVKKQDSTSAQ